ncbi:MAG: pilin [Candidatus Methylumidiphilus sp.]
MTTTDHAEALHSLLLSLAMEKTLSDEILTEALALLKKPFAQYNISDYKRNQLLDDLLRGAVGVEAFMQAWQQIPLDNPTPPPKPPAPPVKPAAQPNKTQTYILLAAVIVAVLAAGVYGTWQRRQTVEIIQRESVLDAPAPTTATNEPNYARQYATEGMSLASMAKTSVAEYYVSMGKYPANNAEAGLPAPTEIRGDGVDSVTVAPGGIITVQYNHLVGDNPTLVIAPESANSGGMIVWDCKGGTLPTTYRPPHCR